MSSVVQIPSKTIVYGTLVGLVNTSIPQFGQTAVERLGQLLQRSLDRHEFPTTKSLLRFCGELVNSNVTTPHSLLSIFESLLAEISVEGGGRRVDHFVLLVMSALPWVGQEIAIDNESKLNELMQRMEGYIDRRSRDVRPLPLLHVFPYDSQSEYVAWLWGAILQLRDRDWDCKVIYRPHKLFQEKLAKGPHHTLPPITLPPPLEGQQYPLPPRRFRMISEVESERGLSRVDRFVLEDIYRDTIYHFHQDHRQCVDMLLQVLGVDSPPLPLLCETIFSQLLSLPSPPFHQVYYSDLLADLCKLAPGFPKVVSYLILLSQKLKGVVASRLLP
jgi:nuclear cap-binding protein subunit 1